MSKKVPVEVLIDKIPSDWLLWMYISWYPSNQTQEWVLIPYDLIRYNYWKAFVFKKIWDKKLWKFEKIFIKIWKCDKIFCLVKENLNDWDLIK